MLNGGKYAARKLKRAQILLAAGGGMTHAVIAASVSIGESTVYRTKRRFVEGNLAELEIGVLRGQCLDRRIGDPRNCSRKSLLG
jgi:transposase